MGYLLYNFGNYGRNRQSIFSTSKRINIIYITMALASQERIYLELWTKLLENSSSAIDVYFLYKSDMDHIAYIYLISNRQPTLWLHDICLEVLIVLCKKLCLFMGQDMTPTLTTSATCRLNSTIFKFFVWIRLKLDTFQTTCLS